MRVALARALFISPSLLLLDRLDSLLVDLVGMHKRVVLDPQYDGGRRRLAVAVRDDAARRAAHRARRDEERDADPLGKRGRRRCGCGAHLDVDVALRLVTAHGRHRGSPHPLASTQYSAPTRDQHAASLLHRTHGRPLANSPSHTSAENATGAAIAHAGTSAGAAMDGSGTDGRG
jgi:hypothetical protein